MKDDNLVYLIIGVVIGLLIAPHLIVLLRKAEEQESATISSDGSEC